MLNSRQARYVNRAIRVKVLFNKNSKLITTYKPMQKEFTGLLASLDLVESELPEKDLNGSGETDAKDARKKVVAEQSSTICGFAKSYAVATGDADLSETMGCCYSDIVKMKDTELLGWVTKQYNLLLPLVTDEIFAEYGVTAEMLETMLTLAKTFNDNLGKAAVTDAGSSVANKNINAAIKAMNGNVKQFDLLIPFFAKTSPDLVKNYFVAKKINDAGVKHSGVEGKVTKKTTGEPIEKAIVRLADTTKLTKSTLTGGYEIIKVRTGDYKLEVVVDDVVVASKVIYIPRGKVVELNMAV